MMIRYPKRIPAGTVRDETVLDIDIAPTILDLAGVPIPAPMEGKSMLPLAQTPDASFRKEWYYRYYEWVNPEGVRPHRGIRTDDFKLIHYTMEPQEFELYDLKNDSGETNNLYGDPHYADQQQQLWNRMQELEAQIPERPRIEPKRVSA
jgi:arylsulfatase A-like enzyme